MQITKFGRKNIISYFRSCLTGRVNVVALGASSTNTGAVSVQFVPRINIGESLLASSPRIRGQGSNKVLATSTNKAVAGQSDSASSSLPRYGLLFLSGVSGLGLLLSKKYS